MASGSFKQIDVQCPFYKEDDGRSRITCEGFGTARNAHFTYKYKEEFCTQMETFCCKYFKKCEYNIMLRKFKYEEEE